MDVLLYKFWWLKLALIRCSRKIIDKNRCLLNVPIKKTLLENANAIQSPTSHIEVSTWKALKTSVKTTMKTPIKTDVLIKAIRKIALSLPVRTKIPQIDENDIMAKKRGIIYFSV